MSPTDPTSALTTRGRSKVMFSYSLNYLIDMEHAVIMDEMTNRHFRFGAGFMLSCPAFPLGGQASNFGHIGLGGAVGFGDPVGKLGFSYCGNRMTPIADEGPFASRLTRAMYKSLGH